MRICKKAVICMLSVHIYVCNLYTHCIVVMNRILSQPHENTVRFAGFQKRVSVLLTLRTPVSESSAIYLRHITNKARYSTQSNRCYLRVS